MVATPAFAAETPSGIPFTDLESQIDTLVNEHLGTTTPGAAVVVVHEGEIIFSRGYGYADLARRIPVDPAVTVFEYGSIGKVFVYTAVMQLVEQGLLDLDADITIYMPADIARQFAFRYPITMRHLLNHTAGFEEAILDFIFDAREMETSRGVTTEEAHLATNITQIFAPGTVAAYSNFGNSLAALIVEYISGQSFADFEREHILRPAGMENTLNQPDWLGNHSFLANKAKGYIPDGEGGFTETIWSYGPLYAAGFINGTAEDLARFAISLTPPTGEPGPLFDSADALAQMLSSSAPDPMSPGNYHGFLTYRGAMTGIGHGGTLPGFSTNFAVVPEARFGFVVLANGAGEAEIVYGLTNLFLGTAPMPDAPAASELPATSAVAGRYLGARRFDSNFLAVLSFFTSLTEVTALDDTTIRISLFGGAETADFRQIAPYVYHMISASDPLLQAEMDEIRFEMRDGVPVYLHAACIFSATALPAGRTMPFLMFYMITTLGSALFFLFMPVALFIAFLVKRKKKLERTRFQLLSTGFLLSGTLLLLNNVILLGRPLMNMFGLTSAGLAPHIWLNFVFAVLSIALFVGALLRLGKDGAGKGRKVLYMITTILTALLLFTLFNWNFFVLL